MKKQVKKATNGKGKHGTLHAIEGVAIGIVILILIFLVFGLLKLGAPSQKIVLEKTTINGNPTSDPQDLRLPDFRLYSDGRVVYKRHTAAYRSKDFDLFEAQLTRSDMNGLLNIIRDNGFYNLPDVIGDEEGNSPIYFMAEISGKSKTVVLYGLSNQHSVLQGVDLLLSDFKADGEKLYVPELVYVQAIPLSGRNAENAKKYMKPAEWKAEQIRLADIGVGVKEFSREAEVSEVLREADGEFFVHFVESNKIYQAFIKWGIK